MSIENLVEAGLRVRLAERSQKELWAEISERGYGSVAEELGVPNSRLYNWKSSKGFVPARIVDEFLEEPVIATIKGQGRSKPIEGFEPRNIDAELLTRVQESVSVNSDGVPVYQNAEIGPAKRFMELLDRIGDVSYTHYSRDVHEIRYPKYLHELFLTLDFEPEFAAQVDESGDVVGGKLRVHERSMDVSEFTGDLYSRQKRLDLALEREDSEIIESMIRDERSLVDRFEI